METIKKGLGSQLITRYYLQNISRIAAAMIVYMVSSFCTNMYDSYLLSRKEYNFSFPLFLNTVYNFGSFILALVMREEKEPTISFAHYLPCGLLISIDIALSRYSLRFVSIPLYLIGKSTTPLFVILLALILKIEKFMLQWIPIFLLVSSGCVLTMMCKLDFNLYGFLMVLASSGISATKWILLQKLVSHEGSVAQTIQNTSLIVAVSLLVMSVVTEGAHNIVRSRFFSTEDAVASTCIILFLGCILSFFHIFMQLKIVSMSSVTFYSLFSILKDGATILVSSIVLNYTLKPINYLGLALLVFGVSSYQVLLLKKKNLFKKKEEPKEQTNIVAVK